MNAFYARDVSGNEVDMGFMIKSMKKEMPNIWKISSTKLSFAADYKQIRPKVSGSAAMI